MPERWRLIYESGVKTQDSQPETRNPNMNMAVDEAITQAHSVSRATIRFYKWEKPSVTIGYSQRIMPVINWLNHNSPYSPFTKGGVDIVRRPTGGGIVLHGNDLTYSVAVKTPDTKTRNQIPLFYKQMGMAVIEGLRLIGINAEFCTQTSLFNPHANLSMCAQTPVEFDVLVEGIKVAGCAARRFKESLLLQGYISIGDFNKMMSLDVADTVIKGFALALDIELEEGKLTDEELALARELNSNKYCSKEWNYKR